MATFPWQSNKAFFFFFHFFHFFFHSFLQYFIQEILLRDSTCYWDTEAKFWNRTSPFLFSCHDVLCPLTQACSQEGIRQSLFTFQNECRKLHFQSKVKYGSSVFRWGSLLSACHQHLMMLKIIRTLSRNSLCLWQVTWVIREYNALIWDNQWHTQWFYDLRCMLSCFSCVWLFVTPWTQQATDVISQARILEWVAVPASRGSSRLSDWARISYVSCTASRFFTTSATWKPQIIWGGGTRLQTSGNLNSALLRNHLLLLPKVLTTI